MTLAAFKHFQVFHRTDFLVRFSTTASNRTLSSNFINSFHLVLSIILNFQSVSLNFQSVCPRFSYLRILQGWGLIESLIHTFPYLLLSSPFLFIINLLYLSTLLSSYSQLFYLCHFFFLLIFLLCIFSLALSSPCHNF